MSDSSSLYYRFFEYVFKINAGAFSIGSVFVDYIVSGEKERIDFTVDVSACDKLPAVGSGSGKFPITGGFLSYSEDIIRIEALNKDFFIRRTGAKFRVYIPENYGLKNIPQILLEIVFQSGLRDKGLIPLHASAVRLERNIIFAGKTGSGKSTLAYSICRIGGEALADDRVYIFNQDDKTLVRSNSAKILLRNDTNGETTGKTVYESGSSPIMDETFIPELLIFPEFSSVEHPVVEAANPADTVMRLAPLTLPPVSKKDLIPVYDLARRCPAFVLSIPRNKDKLDEVMEIIQNIK